MKKVLVANRGEIAVRILRACREMGFASVAVYSEGDDGALHTRYADEAVCIGPTPAAKSYLNAAAVLRAAHDSGADAIHPGYGFLSENDKFAAAVEQAGLIFIGPRPETIALTGDKLAARRAARRAGLTVLGGADVPFTEEIDASLAADLKFPLLVKAVSGGGGRGIRLAHHHEDLKNMVAAARQEAQAAFGDDTVYLEPLVQNARHIEVQIMGDGAGNILCLGERECSIQRRRQKLIEEAPAPGLSIAVRSQLYEAALQLARALNYRSLGTVEFLLDRENRYFFIEVNPRIQVEHPVTEMVTGIDLVTAQLHLAAGGGLPYSQEQIRMRGWAIEARVLAEDTTDGFLPATGEISLLKEPGGPGIRVDSALFLGMKVTADYDSLIAKVIAWGEDRVQANRRLRRALAEFQIGGIPTDVNFLLQVLESKAYLNGNTDTTYLDTFQPAEEAGGDLLEQEMAVAAAILMHQEKQERNGAPAQRASGWQAAAWREQLRGFSR
ncbi:MAG: biotin carboxylase N-terminal domain-containing protein [Anaerolineaceae bacterium]|jgi:acetyl-CoA carboxylase biotin carboxylase subunit